VAHDHGHAQDIKIQVQAVSQESGQKLVATSNLPNSEQQYRLSYEFIPPGAKPAEPGLEPQSEPVGFSGGPEVKVDIGDAAPGTYKFTPIPVKRKMWLTGETTMYLRIPSLEIKAEGGAANPKVDGALPDYQRMFLYPSGTALAAAIMLLLFFFPPKMQVGEKKPTAMAH
jgi:hypothetical protein